MFSLYGHVIGDAWYFGTDGTVHMYFLTRPVDGGAGWDIGHAVTDDLLRWEYYGLALTRGEAGSWDDRSLATGSVVFRDGRYWMADTGHKSDERAFVQRVGIAVSDDLEHWEKLPENPTSEAAGEFYELVVDWPAHANALARPVHAGYRSGGHPVRMRTTYGRRRDGQRHGRHSAVDRHAALGVDAAPRTRSHRGGDGGPPGVRHRRPLLPGLLHP
jgi:hypothetical protein